MNDDTIRNQSLCAYNQWKEQWREHAKIHASSPVSSPGTEYARTFASKPLSDFINVGVGKACVCVANGFSTEKEIETLRELQGNVDILICDKAMGHLLDRGIRPTYVLVCDANVNYEKYMEPWKDKLEGVILMANVCCNPKWTHNGNWADIRFFTLEDVLHSEKEFGGLSGCPNVIPAGTNVSNAMVILLTQSNNTGRKNFFGYDKILLIGFDYSWSHRGNYYAFDFDGGGKRHYMRHVYGKNLAGDLCWTSNNLAFSAAWLETYINHFRLPVVQCSKDSILGLKNQGRLREQMQYNFRQKDKKKVRQLTDRMRECKRALVEIEKEICQIGMDHWAAFQASV